MGESRSSKQEEADDDHHATSATPTAASWITASSNGIDVTLSWSPSRNDLFVTVHDGGDSFELAVEAHEALDAFDHPYAYAARRSRSSDRRAAAAAGRLPPDPTGRRRS